MATSMCSRWCGQQARWRRRERGHRLVAAVRQADVSPDAVCFECPSTWHGGDRRPAGGGTGGVIATALLTRQSAQLRALRGDQLRAQYGRGRNAGTCGAACVRTQRTADHGAQRALGAPIELQAPLPCSCSWSMRSRCSTCAICLRMAGRTPRRGARSSRCVPGRGWARAPTSAADHIQARLRDGDMQRSAAAARITDRTGAAGCRSGGVAGAGATHRGVAGTDPGQCQHQRPARSAGGDACGRAGIGCRRCSVSATLAIGCSIAATSPTDSN